jgi:hypothetical protein
MPLILSRSHVSSVFIPAKFSPVLGLPIFPSKCRGKFQFVINLCCQGPWRHYAAHATSRADEVIE